MTRSIHIPTAKIPSTQNETWGFWGTMHELARTAWPLAMNAISDATHQSLDSVRIFLDSRHGRHFADTVQSGLYRGLTLLDAINAATQQWMAWTVGRQTARDYGIPRGMPYLTGFVIHCEVTDEAFSS
jgi:hypothetical protein